MSILQQIESKWYESAASAIISKTMSHPEERFYAGAFWLCYVDYSLFGTPAFALNSESHLANCDEGDEDSTMWSPPEWQFDVLECTEAMFPLYDAFSQSLSGQDESIWDTAIVEHWLALARVSQTLTHDARNRTGLFSQTDLPADFVVGIFDLREGEPTFSRLVRASIAPEILATLPSPSWEDAEE